MAGRETVHAFEIVPGIRTSLFDSDDLINRANGISLDFTKTHDDHIREIRRVCDNLRFNTFAYSEKIAELMECLEQLTFAMVCAEEFGDRAIIIANTDKYILNQGAIFVFNTDTDQTPISPEIWTKMTTIPKLQAALFKILSTIIDAKHQSIEAASHLGVQLATMPAQTDRDDGVSPVIHGARMFAFRPERVEMSIAYALVCDAEFMDFFKAKLVRVVGRQVYKSFDRKSGETLGTGQVYSTETTESTNIRMEALFTRVKSMIIEGSEVYQNFKLGSADLEVYNNYLNYEEIKFKYLKEVKMDDEMERNSAHITWIIYNPSMDLAQKLYTDHFGTIPEIAAVAEPALQKILIYRIIDFISQIFENEYLMFDTFRRQDCYHFASKTFSTSQGLSSIIGTNAVPIHAISGIFAKSNREEDDVIENLILTSITNMLADISDLDNGKSPIQDIVALELLNLALGPKPALISDRKSVDKILGLNREVELIKSMLRENPKFAKTLVAAWARYVRDSRNRMIILLSGKLIFHVPFYSELREKLTHG